jgi:hypothetical protein
LGTSYLLRCEVLAPANCRINGCAVSYFLLCCHNEAAEYVWKITGTIITGIMKKQTFPNHSQCIGDPIDLDYFTKTFSNDSEKTLSLARDRCFVKEPHINHQLVGTSLLNGDTAPYPLLCVVETILFLSIEANTLAHKHGYDRCSLSKSGMRVGRLKHRIEFGSLKVVMPTRSRSLRYLYTVSELLQMCEKVLRAQNHDKSISHQLMTAGPAHRGQQPYLHPD